MNSPGGRRQEAAGPRGRRAHRPREQDRDVQLSKALSYALRHGALKLGLPMRAALSWTAQKLPPRPPPQARFAGQTHEPGARRLLFPREPWRTQCDLGQILLAGPQFPYLRQKVTQMSPYGFVPLDALLQLPQFCGFSAEDVRRVVDTSQKQRFALQPGDPSTGPLIRANQGHSLQVPELELMPLETPQALPLTLVHGTFWRHWPSILLEGLSCRGRTHIHLAPGLPGDPGVISGLWPNCEVAVFIDGPLALADGVPFFRSANGVILTPGNADGFLLPKYFKEALQLRPTRKSLSLAGDEETERQSGPKHSARGKRMTQQ